MADTIEQSFKDLFAEKHEEGEFNGVVVITQNGKITYKGAFGIADIETEEELTTKSIFNLASVSKQFTALCIMILSEKGKLEYDDAITKYLTELPYNNITIRHLLYHTSGLAPYEDVVEDFWEGDEEEDFITNNDLLKMYAKEEPKLVFKPSEKYEYSNTGYAFLASIVERVSKMSFEDFIKENVFEPLDLSNSFALRRPKKAPKKVVQGFTYENEEYEDYSYNYLDGIVGDGNVFASAEDLATYAYALLEGKIVSEATLKEAFTVATLKNGEETEYGFGWELEGVVFVSHTGAWEGYNTYLSIDLEENRIIVVLDNGDNEDVHDITDEAMSEFYD